MSDDRRLQRSPDEEIVQSHHCGEIPPVLVLLQTVRTNQHVADSVSLRYQFSHELLPAHQQEMIIFIDDELPCDEFCLAYIDHIVLALYDHVYLRSGTIFISPFGPQGLPGGHSGYPRACLICLMCVKHTSSKDKPIHDARAASLNVGPFLRSGPGPRNIGKSDRMDR